MSQVARAYLFYLPLNSPFYAINAMSKLAILGTLTLLALLYVNIFLDAALVVAGVAFLLVGRIPVKQIWKFLLLILWITVFFSLSFIFLSKVSGTVTYITWPWGYDITNGTIILWLSQVLRYEAMALSTILFFSVTKDADIIDALRFLQVPYEMCFVTALTLRSCTMFLDDWRTIREAMTSKGVDISKGSPIARAKKELFLIWPLMFLMFSRVKDIAYAIESRGFGSFKKRTRYRDISWNKADVFVHVVCAASLASLIIFRYVLGLALPLTVGFIR